MAAAKLTWEGGYVLGNLIVMLIILAKDWAPPDAVLCLTAIMSVPPKIIEVRDAVQGFSNEGVLTVATLFAAAAGVHKTGALDLIFTPLIGTPRSIRSAILRMSVPVAFASAFLNNTPIVAMMIPVVKDLAARTGLDQKGLLMPLSFATILGGTCTIVGTSTNLVITGQLDAWFAKNKASIPADMQSDYKIRLFDLAPYGVVMALAGIIFMVFTFERLLLGKKKKGAGYAAEPDKHLFRVSVLPNSKVAGKTILAGNLRGLTDLYLASVVRNGNVQIAEPDFVVLAGDILEFVGLPHDIPNLCKKFALAPILEEDEIGFESIEGDSKPLIALRQPSSYGSAGSSGFDLESGARDSAFGFKMQLVLLKVRPAASVIGKTIKEVRFRSTYAASIVSVKRGVESLSGPLGQIVLQEGDELLVDVDRLKFDSESKATFESFEVSKSVVGRQTQAEFAVTMRIDEGSILVGKDIAGSKLRGLNSLFLVAVEQVNGNVIHAVGPSYVFQAGDVLYLAGNASDIARLRTYPGLVPHSADQIGKLSETSTRKRELVQVVLSSHSPLNGQTIRAVRFRSRFDAVVLAVTHNGERLKNAKIGDLVLRGGDVLLLEAGPNFFRNHEHDPVFALVQPIEKLGDMHKPIWRAAVAIICIAISMAMASFEYVSLLVMIVYSITVMCLTGCIKFEDARKAVNWEVIIAVAAAFGISNAMTKSGLAGWIGSGMVNLAKEVSGGDKPAIFPLVACLFICTVLLSEILTNNAAAALMFPIAIDVVTKTTAPVKIVMFTIMLAASDYATPFGYQTNLMVYSAGNYNFMDFFRAGGCLQIVTTVAAIAVLSTFKVWYVYWIVGFGLLTATAVYVEGGDNLKIWWKRRQQAKLHGSDHGGSSERLDTPLEENHRS